MDLCEQSPVMLCQPSWCWEDRNVPAGGVGWKTNHIFLMRQDLIPRFGQVREHHIPFTGNKLLHWWGILLCFIPKCSCVYRGTINSTIYWNVFIDWQYFHFQGDLAIKRNWRKPHFFLPVKLLSTPWPGIRPVLGSQCSVLPMTGGKASPSGDSAHPNTALMPQLSAENLPRCLSAQGRVPRICAVRILFTAPTEGMKHKKLGQQKVPESGYSTLS